MPSPQIPDIKTPHTAASIIIVAYNGLDFLGRCLESVERDLETGDEVVVVDNNSADGGPAFIREQFPAVRLVENRQNLGFAAACNQGARVATGHVLIFLNQDTVVLPGWRDGIVRELASSERIGLATSRVRLMRRPERIHLCGQDVHYTGLVFGRGYEQPAESQEQACDVNAVSGASFGIRRELWERLGGFDETFFMYYEDTDLSWRALAAGYRCRYAPASQVLHDHSPGNPGNARLYYNTRNRLLMVLKHWSLATLVCLAPALLLAEVLDLGLALGFGRRGVRAKLRGCWWIATHLGELRRMRASAGVHRQSPDAALLSMLASGVAARSGGSQVERSIVTLANGIFRANRRVALWLLRGSQPHAARREQRARP